ncbi:unnamed protein product [Camellia sinensis]
MFGFHGPPSWCLSCDLYIDYRFVAIEYAYDVFVNMFIREPACLLLWKLAIYVGHTKTKLVDL